MDIFFVQLNEKQTECISNIDDSSSPPAEPSYTGVTSEFSDEFPFNVENSVR